MVSNDAPRPVIAAGDRGIAIGGDAINSLLVTGDNNTFFVGRYERLADAYLDPRVLYEEVALDRFTGREWLVSFIDGFLTAQDRGYIIIEADAGMGKSTFLAWLAQRRGYVHHFVRLMPDPQDVGAAMKNLATQLITSWDLDTHAIGGVLPPSAERPDFLLEVMADAARRRDRSRPGEKIVLVVDGLNETVPAAGQNPLGLPRSLPEGVYVIVSQRTMQVPLRVDVPRQVIAIQADSEANMRDIHAYLELMAESSEIRPRLESSGVSGETFVNTLLDRSGGVWIYLHYVLAEIDRGTRSPRDIDKLPMGLWHYYAHYWHGWQRTHADRWPEVDLPLLATIAAAAEALPASTLARLAGISRQATVESLLEDEWRPFIQVDETGDDVVYRAFHDSLKEFLHGEVDTGSLTTAERSLATRLARTTKSAHASIADHYLDAWGGTAQGLPVLREGAKPRDEYGLRHVAEHLDHAGRDDDLHALLALSWREGSGSVNAWFSVHRRLGELGAYQRDVTTAWNTVRREPAGSSRLRLRYALIMSSLVSQTLSTPPMLWSSLVEHGHMSAVEALAHARQIPSGEDRSEAISGLIPAVPDGMREEVEREALAAVRAVPDGFWRVGELWRLQRHLSPELRAELVELVSSLSDPYYQVVAYRLLGRDDAVPTLAAKPGAGFEQDLESQSGLAGSARFIEDYLNRRRFAAERLTQADFAATGDVNDPTERYWRTHLLTLAALDASGDEQRDLTMEAMDLSGDIGDHRHVRRAWGVLGSLLAEPQERIVELSTAISVPAYRAAFLLGGARRDAELAGPAAAALGESGGDDVRADILSERGLGSPYAEAITDPMARATTLLAAAPDEGESLDQALTLITEHVDRWPAGLLSRAAQAAPAAVLPRLRELAVGRTDPETRAAVLASVGTRYCELGLVTEAEEILAELTGLWRASVAYALGVAQATAGDPHRALELADELTLAPWRGEVIARACDRLGGPVETMFAEATRLEPGLPAASRTAVLARMAASGPAGLGDALLADSLALAEEIDNVHERSVALLAIVEARVARGELPLALETSRSIPIDGVRAAALAPLTFPIGAPLPAIAEDAASFLDVEARAQVTVRLVAALRSAAAPTDTLSGALDDALADLATLSRAELLDSLQELLPAVLLLEGVDAAKIVTDLIDIVSWWP